MSHKPAIDAPFDDWYRWLIVDGVTVPIVRRTRRTVTVDHFGRRYELKRRDLERTGEAHAGGLTFRVSCYTHSPNMEQAS